MRQSILRTFLIKADLRKFHESGKLLYCSFCGKSQHEVRKLIAGPSVFICDECVELCNDIIREEIDDTKGPSTSKKLPTPREINENLDQYVEIIKANNNIVSTKKKDMNETSKQKFIATLRFRILTTFNNGQGKAKHTTNGRAIKGIKERLAGKDGQFRMNIMGKRCNQSGRSVIGPDPTLKFGEIAVPEAMANILTIPVTVTDFNINELQKLCDNGRIDSVLKNNGSTRINIKRYRKGTKLIENDIIKRDGKEIKVVTGREPVLPGDVIIRNGQLLDKLLHVNRSYPLEIGSVVERKLQDGDWVLLNRQPTLHKASMLGMQIKVKPHCTIRMNLAVTKPFNKSLVGNRRL